MSLGDRARKFLNRIGIDVYRYPMLSDRRLARSLAMKHKAISLLLDVGANVGQYATEVREFGYGGRMISFEPVSSAFAKLREAAAGDPSWELRQVALGETDGTVEINLADTLSSILPRDPGSGNMFSTETLGTETVKLKRLDTLWPELYRAGDRAWLKMDVQGYETNVLRGAGNALKQIAGVEMEMALKPIYQGVPLYRDMIAFMESQGFTLWSLQPGSRDMAKGRLMEMDGLFVRD
jgi:FkbM family methyltransferase